MSTETPRDYTLEIRENDKRLSIQPIEDPFHRTAIRPRGWRVALAVLRHRYKVEVVVNGSPETIRHVMSGVQDARPSSHAAEYVLASRLAEVERERDRLRAKGLDDFTVTADEHERLLDERDVLRARVEELEAQIDAALATTWTLDDEGGWGTEEDTLHPDRASALAALVPYWRAWGDEAWEKAGRAESALLSGGSQEPRPVAICECCENPTTRPYVHPEEGIDLCAPCVAALPREEWTPKEEQT